MWHGKGMVSGGVVAGTVGPRAGGCLTRLAAPIAVIGVVALAGWGQAATTPGSGSAGTGATVTGRVTGTPDTVIHQGPQIAWQTAAPPPEGAQVVVARSDGNTAYSCNVVQPKGDGTTHIWATHDRGQHWAEAGTFVALTGATTCRLVVDDNNASVLAATFGLWRLIARAVSWRGVCQLRWRRDLAVAGHGRGD